MLKEFLLTLLNGFLFILFVAVVIYIGLCIVIIIGTIVPKPILAICGTIFVVWFVGALIG